MDKQAAVVPNRWCFAEAYKNCTNGNFNKMHLCVFSYFFAPQVQVHLLRAADIQVKTMQPLIICVLSLEPAL